MNEKIDAVIGKGKDTAKAAFDKGNEIMDKVPFLKNPLYKKIAWGVIAVVMLALVLRVFGCWGNSGVSVDTLAKWCEEYIVAQYGADSVKRFDPDSYQYSEDGNRVLLKADVKIEAPASIAPVRDAVDIAGTIVFYLEQRDDEWYVVDLDLQ